MIHSEVWKMRRAAAGLRERPGFGLMVLLGLAAMLPVSAAGQEPPAQEPEERKKAEPEAQAAKDVQAQPGRVPAAGPVDRPQEGRRLPPGRVQQIIEGLDPKLLNLTGAELDVEVVGDQLILRGTEDDLAVVELLIAILESTTERKVLRVVTVTDKDANDIASRAAEPLRQMFRRPNMRPEDEVQITALSSNILLVSALPADIDRVVEIVEQVDAAEEPLPELEQLVFPVQHRKATDVAEQLTEILQKMQAKVGATGPKSEIQVIPVEANNSIMVLAPETEREKIARLLKEIDVEPVPGWGEVKLTFYPLLHSQAGELAEVITEILTSQVEREAAEETIYRLQISKALPSGEVIDLPSINLQRPTRIIPDEGTNSLVVATVEENVQPVGELIRLLDGVPVSEEVSVKLFPLRFADAEGVAEVLEQMFDDGKNLPEDPDGSGANSVPEGVVGKAVSYNVSVTADTRTNTLIVTGRQEQLLLAEMVVQELDMPSTALKFPLRFMQLEHTDATKVGQIITELFDQRFEAAEGMGAGRAALERERVFLTVDIRTNTLIVSASEENVEEIRTIVGQLDTEPVRLFDQIRIINLERLSAADIKEKIDELWERKAELRRQEELFEDLPVVVVDDRSNSLIVASSIEDYQEISTLVASLEAQPLIDDTRLFKLEYADAAVLAEMLTQLFEGIASASETFEAPTILADPRSNAVVVAATRDGMERAADLIDRLDVAGGPHTAVFKVYPLENASATQLATRMQELFDSRSENREIPGTPIVILPDTTSNSLITSASRDDHEVIAELLVLLDRPSSLARQFEIFPLKMARAATVAEKLENLFQSQGDAGEGTAHAIATAADERTNSVIVWASPSQLVNVREVIERLDTATPVVEKTVKVIQLRQALAEDFADLLQRTVVGEEAGTDQEQAVIVSFFDRQPDGTEQLRKLLRQDIQIEADTRTNSLMVMAPAESMEMLEALIRDFDRIRPIRSEVRLFPLVNSDAESMVDQLEQLFEAREGGGEGDAVNQLVFGDTIGETDVASVGQDLRFAADIRTNTLIAAGAEVDLRMVEQLIRYLDSLEAEDRVTEVLQTKYLDPSDIASAIQNYNQQEQEVLGDIESREAQQRRAERQVTVEAVGGEEQRGRSLIVGTSRARYHETMRMIDALDRPEPQVRISVLIAEVTLTDDMELGVEVAGQDLLFSEKAVVGPNGIVQGSEFDFVGGTSLGALANTLGFNFTITGEDFSFLFHALQQNSRLEVLSRPTILVRNGDEGNITIADEVPFVESSQINDTGSTNTVVGREEVGIVLTATPQISPDGYVTIELSQEISNFSGENFQISEGVTQPIFATREVDTNVTVRDGETVVIGGLITSRKSEGVNKVPLLGDLPWVGNLFRSISYSEQKTELLIVMTVDVVRTDEEAYQMSIAERDRFVLPDSIRQSPLMEGLRILPDESLMGPIPEGGRVSPQRRQRTRPPANGRGPLGAPPNDEPYGPRPKTYGPEVPRTEPTSTTTTDARKAVYGPTVVRNDARVTPED